MEILTILLIGFVSVYGTKTKKTNAHRKYAHNLTLTTIRFEHNHRVDVVNDKIGGKMLLSNRPLAAECIKC